jgi:hypothetical protein
MPETAAKAARAQAGARYGNFVVALGRRLSEGPKLRQEIPDDVGRAKDDRSSQSRQTHCNQASMILYYQIRY